MSLVMKASNLTEDILNKATIPIILCSYQNRVSRLLEKYQYNSLNLNIKLAEALIRFPQPQRSKLVNDEIMRIASQCHKPTFFDDYEILFDPRYHIDAIKVFTEIARQQKVVVKWCGRLNGNSLEYATPEYKDYHLFRIQDYNITCVI